MSIDRKKLTEIIEIEHGINWWKPELFEQKVLPLLPRELKIVSPPPTHSDNYNCFVFIFGLKNDSEFLSGNNPIQGEFVQDTLINREVLTVVKLPSKNDWVFYKDKSGKITHAGIMESEDEVISKWMWGPIIIHKLFDVPSSFGNEILFFKPIATSKIKKIYNAYKKSGVEIEPIG